jgi:hypothetical protein
VPLPGQRHAVLPTVLTGTRIEDFPINSIYKLEGISLFHQSIKLEIIPNAHGEADREAGASPKAASPLAGRSAEVVDVVLA